MFQTYNFEIDARSPVDSELIMRTVQDQHWTHQVGRYGMYAFPQNARWQG